VSLLLALALAACEHPALSSLGTEEQAAACRLLERSAARAGEGPDVAALGAIYAQPGFERARRRDSGALAAWLAQLRSRLLALFETSGAEKYSNVTRVLVLVLALLAVALITLRLGGWARRRRQQRPAPAPGLAERLPLDSPALHLARARALQVEHPREALREGLFALLSWLEQRQLARPDRVKTNRELALELAERGAPAPLVAAVAPLLERYDEAFYSLEPVSQQSAGRFVAEVAPLLEPPP
jgi:hypothetical protein